MSYQDHRETPSLVRPSPYRVRPRKHPGCAPWTPLLPDAADGLLSEAERTALQVHLDSCPACSLELAEAQRGVAWLTLLAEDVPEPPASLLGDVLAKTTGLAEAGVYLPELSAVTEASVTADTVQAGQGIRRWLRAEAGTWSTVLQPRLTMTGAMAFFSICLTMNLLGFSLGDLHAQTLRKGELQSTVANTEASLMRSFQQLRMAYQGQLDTNDAATRVSTHR